MNYSFRFLLAITWIVFWVVGIFTWVIAPSNFNIPWWAPFVSTSIVVFIITGAVWIVGGFKD